MGEMVHDNAVILLAAGRSARLGRPKQLLVHEGDTLLRRAANTALAAGFGRVYVVLGAARQELEAELQGLPVTIVENDGWEEGMASSIRKGLGRMEKDAEGMDGALIMVCDQPRVTGSLLQALVARQQESGLPIVASRYGDIKGTPALFHRSMFPLLLELKGDRGAGKLLADKPEKVATVDFPEGANDIDTMADYERLTKS